ncbi:MAG: UDP-N-acetylmuramoyl-tripeptide--D-alanyl-D-alanine ligase [Elusimicrobia bacterium]|nr:UDP-N-acetylmuramoyl-tripeptide--D-alanyl-D-alanine ligase [Elusimicrobiota bacterium]
MNLDMTWAELARAAGGKLLRGDPVRGVGPISTDTRTLQAGEVFWALQGPRIDAHDLLTKELADKASGWVMALGRLPPSTASPEHVVVVPDTLKALQALAAHHRRRFDIPVVGITGSNGKTTTKEMLLCICRRVGATCASPGNRNNQIGVPLSVLELTREHRYGIFELADSKPGDIAEVARIAHPTLAVITNLGPDHLEFYGTMERNFQTKAELIEALGEEGKAVINIDDPWLAGLEPRLGSRAVTFGTDARARVSLAGVDEFIIDRHRVKVALRAFGRLSRYDAAAAAAAAWALGIPPEAIRKGLEDYRPGQWRMEPMRHASHCSVIFDAYNANPASMRAAIEAFCAEFCTEGKVLVLGDMKELGKESARFHRELGEWLATLPLYAVYLAGPEMAPAFQALRGAKPDFQVRHGATPEAWLKELRFDCARDKAILFKASRAMRFEDIAAALQMQAMP